MSKISHPKSFGTKSPKKEETTNFANLANGDCFKKSSRKKELFLRKIDTTRAIPVQGGDIVSCKPDEKVDRYSQELSYFFRQLAQIPVGTHIHFPTEESNTEKSFPDIRRTFEIVSPGLCQEVVPDKLRDRVIPERRNVRLDLWVWEKNFKGSKPIPPATNPAPG